MIVIVNQTIRQMLLGAPLLFNTRDINESSTTQPSYVQLCTHRARSELLSEQAFSNVKPIESKKERKRRKTIM
jgi:hypothetical protein